jgi:hypothetical protein
MKLDGRRLVEGDGATADERFVTMAQSRGASVRDEPATRRPWLRGRAATTVVNPYAHRRTGRYHPRPRGRPR